MIKRVITQNIVSRMFRGKAIVLYGARQVGKTTLSEAILTSWSNDVLMLSGDDADTNVIFSEATAPKLKTIIGSRKILFLDEAQRIKNIGLCIKIIVDQIPEIQVFATGSSSFELVDRIKESLAGRAWEFLLFPLSFPEMSLHHEFLTEKRLLSHRLVYGYYPEIITHPGDEKALLLSLVEATLYKDILSLERVRKPALLQKLIRALALQIGQEVSYNEVAQLIGSDHETVERYIDILERSFILFSLPAFSRNVRNEIKKGRKIYFYDNGIRNAIIEDFRPLQMRPDVGALWENFLIVERIKHKHYAGIYGKSYFWRTAQQQEIDYIEERDGEIFAWEFKWNARKKTRFPITFLKAYNPVIAEILTSENFQSFIMP